MTKQRKKAAKLLIEISFLFQPAVQKNKDSLFTIIDNNLEKRQILTFKKLKLDISAWKIT